MKSYVMAVSDVYLSSLHYMPLHARGLAVLLLL